MNSLHAVDIFSGYSYLGSCDQFIWDGDIILASELPLKNNSSKFCRFWIRNFRCVADFETLFLKNDLVLINSDKKEYILKEYYITDISNIKNIRGVASSLSYLEHSFPKFKGVSSLQINPVLSAEAHIEVFRTLSSVFSNINYNKLVMLDKVVQLVEKLWYQINKNISNVINLIESQDLYDYILAHNANVALLSMIFAKSIGYDNSRVLDLGVSGLLHDVGIAKVPSRIVYKTTKLTEAELSNLRKHPKMSYELLGTSEVISQRAKQIILFHHERVSGKGYPTGLSGNDVPQLAQICALVDIFDAMTSKRPYRNAYSPYFTLRHIISALDKDFDRDILSEFVKFMTVYPVGTKVLLSDNRKAIVIKSNFCNLLKPVVRIIQDKFEDVIDLSKCKELYIVRVLE